VTTGVNGTAVPLPRAGLLLRHRIGDPGDVLRAGDRLVGRRVAGRPETEERLESGGQVLPPVVPEDELVEVGGELMAADTLVRPCQPGLEVADGVMEVRHGVDEALAPALDAPLVDETGLGQREVGRPAVGTPGPGGDDQERKPSWTETFELLPAAES
jgi:hypothetical protein